MTSRGHTDLTELRAALRADAAAIGEALLGAPNKAVSTKSTLRWGGKGSVALEVRGPKQGLWYSHEADTGSDMLGLVQHARQCSFPDAVAWAQSWTGIAPGTAANDDEQDAQRRAQQDADRQARQAERDAETAQDEAGRVAYACSLWAASVPIEGTVAERYLVEMRRIPAPKTTLDDIQGCSGGWPAAVRFHSPSRSLILAATLATGDIVAVQRVRLTPEGTKAEGTPERPTKQTNGVLAGAAVRLPAVNKSASCADVLAPLLLGEGPETGLSLWAATGRETWIALGSVAGVPLPPDRRVVACRDDDPKHSPADRKMAKAIGGWRSAGHQVAVATPWPFRAYDKTDFNDCLKLDGVAGVRRRIEAALNPGGGPATRLPIKQVREKLRAAVDGFYDTVRDWDNRNVTAWDPDAPSPAVAPENFADLLDQPVPDSPPPAAMPVHAVKVDLGSGKTLAAIMGAVRFLGEMRAAGDDRSAVFAIPTHALGDEVAATFAIHARDKNLTAAVWRGMSATDPDSPSDPMCRNLEAVADAREAMLDVFKTTCKRKLDNGDVVKCPFFAECGYQKQRESEADLWVVPHDLLFGEKPNTIGKLAFLVVDESVWQDGLEGVHGKPTALSLDTLAQMEKPPVEMSMMQRMDRERLEFLRERLLDVLRASGEGPISAEAIDGSDLTLDNTREAFRLEWARFVDPGMHPAMTKAERRDAVMRAAINATIPRLGNMWKAMTALLEDGGPQRSGWAALATKMTEDGPQRVIHLKGRRTIRKGWLAPTLLIDATMNIDLVRYYWPDANLTAELLADAPHQCVRQVVDRAYSKSAIEPLTEDMPGYTVEEAKRRAKGLRNVHATVNREARMHGGAPVLLVSQKAVKEALPSHGPMAACIDLAHHNAVAGRDQWRNVRSLIVVGRTQAAPASVERMAEALTGRAVEPLKGWYQRGDGVRHASGEAVAIEADRHPDPICEAIRWQVCEGELMQIVGRGRGVNRTETDPLDVLVLTDAPLPIPIAQTIQAAELAPSPADLMLAAGGVVFESPRDAADAYPHLWATKNAAKIAFRGAKVGWNPYEYIILGDAPHLCRADYQRAGQGQQSATAGYDPVLVPSPAEWLSGRLGVLSWCRAEGDPPHPPPNASRPAKPEPPQPPPVEREPATVNDIPAWAPGDPGWSPDDRHSTDPEEMQMADDNCWSRPEEQLLDPSRLYPIVAHHIALAESHDMLIRLPPVRQQRREGQPPPLGRLVPAWAWRGDAP